MHIRTSDYKGNGTIRPYTLTAAIYEVLNGIPVGGSGVIDGVQDMAGKEISVPTLRAGINHVKLSHLPGVVVTTRSNSRGYPVTIYRVA